MVKNAGRFCLGNNHKGTKGRSFRTVGRIVLNFKSTRTGSFRHECRCAAAVTVNSSNATKVNHGLRQFISAHAYRARCLTAINDKQHNTSVSLDADSRARCARSIRMIRRSIQALTILNEELESRCSLPLISLKRLVSASYLGFSVLGQYEVCLSRPLMINDSIYNQHSERLIARPRQVRINSANNIDAELLLSRLGLGRRCLCCPCARIHIAVAGK